MTVLSRSKLKKESTAGCVLAFTGGLLFLLYLIIISNNHQQEQDSAFLLLKEELDQKRKPIRQISILGERNSGTRWTCRCILASKEEKCLIEVT